MDKNEFMRTKIKGYSTLKNSKFEIRNSKFRRRRYGSVLVLVVVSLVILTALGLGLLTIAYGVRHDAIKLKNEAAAMLAAEAGYEQAMFWMSQQLDMLSALQQGASGTSGTLSFSGGSCNYQIGLFSFIGSRPIYRVTATGHSGVFSRTVDVYVVQAISGWDMGQCKVPLGGTSFTKVYFAQGEIIDVPIHINKLNDSPDKKDIYISGSPQFLQPVAMGESRYTTGGSDKYSGVMGLFEGGICFDQPDCRITDKDAVQMKVNRFRTSTDSDYNFSDDTGKKPDGEASVPSPLTPHDAVQLEFFVEGGVGKVQITNNCTVGGFQQSYNSRTYDFKIKPGTDGKQSERYDIYAYHYAVDSVLPTKVNLTDTYVTQSFGGISSEPAGQIYIDGDVVIGSKDYDMVVQGKITVVAAGNIWIADSVKDSDYDDSGNYYPRDSEGMPAMDNPNILGLIAQGVVKVVDPGMTDDNHGSEGFTPEDLIGFKYVPIGRADYPSAEEGEDDYYLRHLPDPMEIEATMAIGGGGWGAENVQRRSVWTYYGGRKEWPGSSEDNWDKLIVRGTIVERCRGVVGIVSYSEGFKKHYYFDERVLSGILPGDIWLQGKYVPAPAGWHDYRSSN